MYRNTLGDRVSSTRRVGALLRRLTEREGREMDSPKSRRLIARFIATHGLDVGEFAASVESFGTFNEFFTRKLRAGARPIVAAGDPTVAVCPADCRLVVFPSVAAAQRIWIKGSEFTLEKLLGPRADLAERLVGGSIVVARLAPQDYHRFHVPVDATLVSQHPVPGVLLTVNPIAVRSAVNVFTENQRVVCEFRSAVCPSLFWMF